MRTLGAALVMAAATMTATTPMAVAQSARALALNDPRADTLARLEKPVSIELKETRLEDVLMFIEQVGDVTLEPMWLDNSGATSGLEKDKAITLSVRGLPLLTMLERVLEKAQGTYGENTWQLTPSGMVEVGPKERLNRHATMKIYDIHDLTFVVPDFPDVPELDLDTVLQQTSQRGGGGGGGGIFNSNDTQTFNADEEERAQEIIDLIVENVEPEQWQQNGGDGATVRLHHGNLLIKAPDYIHRQIAGYPFAQPSGARSSAKGTAERRYVTIGGSVQSATPDGEDSQTVTGATSPAP